MDDAAQQNPFESLRLATAAPLAVLYAAVAAPVFVVGGPMAATALTASAILAAILVALSVIDLKTFRLPDALTLPLIALGIAATAVLNPDSLMWHGASAAIGFGAAVLVAETYKALRERPGLGLGDAKLFAASGAWLGAASLPSVLLYAALGAMIALAVAALRKMELSLTTAIPFGPFLAAGTWLVWLYGPLV